jgi:hypothetical protein
MRAVPNMVLIVSFEKSPPAVRLNPSGTLSIVNSEQAQRSYPAGWDVVGRNQGSVQCNDNLLALPKRNRSAEAGFRKLILSPIGTPHFRKPANADTCVETMFE